MIKQKIQTLLSQMNHDLVGREEAFKIALLTVLCGENIVLIGPPGTGKSMIARRIAESMERVDSNGYFEYLLTKFSTPEEIFGPLSIAELKADRFKRNTVGYLPSAQIAFLDEIFKASSSILNSLLTILNERIFHNGANAQKVPLLSLISASNELPTGEEELAALYDRFLVRIFVDYVREDQLHLLFATPEAVTTDERVTQIDLDFVANAAQQASLPPVIVEIVRSIWSRHKKLFKEDNRERLSDRRLKKVIRFLKVCAVTNGRLEVDLSDVFLLKNCLWNHYDNAEKVRNMILETLQKYSHPVHLSSSNADKPERIEPPIAKQPKASIKGYKGSGVEYDPILINSIEDLMGIDDPAIGLAKYYFRQTTDIDCAGLTHWKPMSFKGRYDGGGYVIRNLPIETGITMFSTNIKNASIFSDIQPESKIVDMILEGCSLAQSANGSVIERCQSTDSLIDTAENCQISSCRAKLELIKESAKNSNIMDCKSYRPLAKDAVGCEFNLCKTSDRIIKENAANCQIKNCAVILSRNAGSNIEGGIAETLTTSLVEHCFVAAAETEKYNYLYGGIAYKSEGKNTIRNCAVGLIQLSNLSIARTVYVCSNETIFENNAAIDTLNGEDDANGKDGKTVAAAIFKQRYFEHTLGWDFVNIWEWDAQNDRPTLRNVATNNRQEKSDASGDTEDLLIQQIRSNIWL